MAEADSIPQQQFTDSEIEEKRLKYFEFVQVATFQAVIYAAKLYGLAKENSGPLKPGVNTVEGTLKNVFAPVYDKYHDVPIDVLKFVDRKVDESVTKAQAHVPPTLKHVSTQAFDTAQKAPIAARSVMAEVKKTGVVETAKNVYSKYEPTAKVIYSKYEPVAEQYANNVWRSLNQIPLFPKVAQAVGPTASYCSDKYNQTVQVSAEKGYKVAAYLPLVPTEKIAKLLSTEKVEPVASH